VWTKKLTKSAVTIVFSGHDILSGRQNFGDMASG